MITHDEFKKAKSNIEKEILDWLNLNPTKKEIVDRMIESIEYTIRRTLKLEDEKQSIVKAKKDKEIH